MRLPSTSRTPVQTSVIGCKIEEGEECFLSSARHSVVFGYFPRTRRATEPAPSRRRTSSRRSAPRTAALGLRLQALRQLVEKVADLVEPAALVPRRWPHLAQHRPEAGRPVSNRQHLCTHATSLGVTHQRQPAFRALPVPVLDCHHLLRAVRPDAHDHQRRQAIFLKADVEVTPSAQTYTHSRSASERSLHAACFLAPDVCVSRVIAPGDKPAASLPSSVGNAC